VSFDDTVVSELAGFEAVTQWFEGWPSFHDAEVISIFLARNGRSVLRIYPCEPKKPAMVDFVLEDVTDIELYDFSNQNVINSLRVETATDQNGDNVYRLILAPCYGLAGRIDAKSLSLQLSPGKSSDGVSSW
jgi:hypothetical protein